MEGTIPIFFCCDLRVIVYIYNISGWWFQTWVKQVEKNRTSNVLLVGGFKHVLFSIIYGIIFHID